PSARTCGLPSCLLGESVWCCPNVAASMRRRSPEPRIPNPEPLSPNPYHMYFNAHVHIELSFLRGALPAGIGFVDWLAQLVMLKRGAGAASVNAAVRAALEEMRAADTAAVLDVDAMGIVPQLIGDSPPFPVHFFTE